MGLGGLTPTFSKYIMSLRRAFESPSINERSIKKIWELQEGVNKSTKRNSQTGIKKNKQYQKTLNHSKNERLNLQFFLLQWHLISPFPPSKFQKLTVNFSKAKLKEKEKAAKSLGAASCRLRYAQHHQEASSTNTQRDQSFFDGHLFYILKWFSNKIKCSKCVICAVLCRIPSTAEWAQEQGCAGSGRRKWAGGENTNWLPGSWALAASCIWVPSRERLVEKAVRRGKSWEREVKVKQAMAAGSNTSNSSKASVLLAPLLQWWLSSCLGMQFPALPQVQSFHDLLKCSCHP